MPGHFYLFIVGCWWHLLCLL